jgi:hypothetical protein
MLDISTNVDTAFFTLVRYRGYGGEAPRRDTAPAPHFLYFLYFIGLEAVTSASINLLQLA